jgi:hypothetical protein
LICVAEAAVALNPEGAFGAAHAWVLAFAVLL